MRLGLLGLGRIGEFHADTLASLPMADSLVADIIPSLTKKVAERLRAEPAASPDALLKSGWTASSSPPAPTPTPS